MAKLVSKVYGDALMQAARDKNVLDDIFEEAQELYQVFEDHQDLIHLLDHPQVVKEEKLQIIRNVFQGNVSDEMMGFLAAVVDKGRQNDILAILGYFIRQVKEEKGIGTAFVTSAVELTKKQKQEVKNKLLATTQYVEFEMNYIVDSSLIGGMVIRIGDRVVDSSIKTRLYELKKQQAYILTMQTVQNRRILILLKK